MRIPIRGLLTVAVCCAALFTTNSVPAQTSCAPVPAGLVGWWAGRSGALDSTGLNNGLTQGGLAYAPGEVGQAFSFNGTDADVDIPASASLNVGAGGGMSVEAWIDPADVTAQHPLVEWNGGYFGAQLWLAVVPPLGPEQEPWSAIWSTSITRNTQFRAPAGWWSRISGSMSP